MEEISPLHKGEGSPSHTASLLHEHQGEMIKSVSPQEPEKIHAMKEMPHSNRDKTLITVWRERPGSIECVQGADRQEPSPIDGTGQCAQGLIDIMELISSNGVPPVLPAGANCYC